MDTGGVGADPLSILSSQARHRCRAWVSVELGPLPQLMLGHPGSGRTSLLGPAAEIWNG